MEKKTIADTITTRTTTAVLSPMRPDPFLGGCSCLRHDARRSTCRDAGHRK